MTTLSMKINDFMHPNPLKIDFIASKIKKIYQDSGQEVNNEQKRPNNTLQERPGGALGGPKGV